jgi:hypothetical protein
MHFCSNTLKQALGNTKTAFRLFLYHSPYPKFES